MTSNSNAKSSVNRVRVVNNELWLSVYKHNNNRHGPFDKGGVITSTKNHQKKRKEREEERYSQRNIIFFIDSTADSMKK